MDTKLQLQLAKEAGKVTHKNYKGKTWLNEYKYHLGMVEKPFPFEKFRMKFNSLNRMFDADPEGKNRSYDKPIQQLCNELGY